MSKQVEIGSTFGLARSGYLHGQAREFAESVMADGGTVSCQGPEMSNASSNLVTLIYHGRNYKPGTGWTVWGKTTIYDKPDPSVPSVPPAQYRIAFETESGGWDVVESFEAANDEAANAYAAEHYPDDEWYVLDASGQNINA